MSPSPQHAALDDTGEPGAPLQVDSSEKAGRPDLRAVDTSDPNYLQESAVPIAYETHSGEDVPIYANGPGAELFHGVQEQSFVYHAMVEALGWNDPAVGRADESGGPAYGGVRAALGSGLLAE